MFLGWNFLNISIWKCSCLFTLISLRKKLSLVSLLEILTAYALILPWTPFVTNGLSRIIEHVKHVQPESNMRWEISMLYVVLIFFCHSEMKLLNLSDIREVTNFISSKRKQELLYIDLPGVTNAMLKVE